MNNLGNLVVIRKREDSRWLSPLTQKYSDKLEITITLNTKTL